MINDKNPNRLDSPKRVSPDGRVDERGPLTTDSKENQKSSLASPENERIQTEIKQAESVMLESEFLISPVIEVNKPPKPLPKPSILNPESSVSKNRFGFFVTKHSQLLFGLLIGFLLSSVLLAAFFLNPTSEDATAQRNLPNSAETANSDESETNSEKEKERENELTAKESKPVEKAPDSRVKRPNDKIETKLNDSKKLPADDRPDFSPPSPNEDDQAELHTSLNGWIKATNNRNFDKQMIYYAPEVKSYYRSRNASASDIRNEKQRVFSGTDSVDIQAGPPQISVAPDGRTATMRFRKKYTIKKGSEYRNGEVLQELKWVKSKKGWRIVSERDLRVVNP